MLYYLSEFTILALGHFYSYSKCHINAII